MELSCGPLRGRLPTQGLYGRGGLSLLAQCPVREHGEDDANGYCRPQQNNAEQEERSYAPGFGQESESEPHGEEICCHNAGCNLKCGQD